MTMVANAKITVFAFLTILTLGLLASQALSLAVGCALIGWAMFLLPALGRKLFAGPRQNSHVHGLMQGLKAKTGAQSAFQSRLLCALLVALTCLILMLNVNFSFELPLVQTGFFVLLVMSFWAVMTLPYMGEHVYKAIFALTVGLSIFAVVKPLALFMPAVMYAFWISGAFLISNMWHLSLRQGRSKGRYLIQI